MQYLSSENLILSVNETEKTTLFIELMFLQADFWAS